MIFERGKQHDGTRTLYFEAFKLKLWAELAGPRSVHYHATAENRAKRWLIERDGTDTHITAGRLWVTWSTAPERRYTELPEVEA